MTKRQQVQALLRCFGVRVLAAYRRLSAGLPDRRCRTCAFRELERSIDGWRGWEASLAGLMKAAAGRYMDQPQIFVCHRRRPGGGWRPHARPRFCAAYAVLAGRPEFEHAACEAAIDAESGA